MIEYAQVKIILLALPCACIHNSVKTKCGNLHIWYPMEIFLWAKTLTQLISCTPLFLHPTPSGNNSVLVVDALKFMSAAHLYENFVILKCIVNHFHPEYIKELT